MVAKTSKLTISLPNNLIAFADELAHEREISRSKVISACLQELAEQHKLADMKEGYLIMAKENRKLAKMAFELQRRAVPEWK